MRKLFLIILFTVAFYTLYATRYPLKSYANNMNVSNVGIDTLDPVTGTMRITFNISWENAWRDGTNYDAAWVFLKYSLDNGATWKHLTLKTSGLNPSGFARGTATVGGASKNLDIFVPTDKKGAWVQIASADSGSGTLSATTMGFVWDYATDEPNMRFSGLIVKVFAIEMVYIPQVTFQLGGTGSATTGTGTGQFRNTFWRYVGYPSYILSKTTWITGEGANNFTSSQDGSDIICVGCSGSISASFPRGYRAFYLMKYEISQGQYRDFLNTLTLQQQVTRVASTAPNYYTMSNNSAVVYRQGIRVPSSVPAGTGPITFGCDLNANGTFNESNDGEWVACNYLSWMDLAAYAAWAALRPMAETEFEKACRGNSNAVANELAWGTVNITQANSISNTGQNIEVAGVAGAGLSVYGSHASVQGPIRSGFAATASTSTRENAGASLFGVLDLSGNLWERCVTVGEANSRMFTAAHGTGFLSASGNAAVAGSWPGCSAGSTEVTTVAPGCRGGSWVESGSGRLLVLDRNMAISTTCVSSTADRHPSYGGRCARTGTW